jgi:cathepsin D
VSVDAMTSGLVDAPVSGLMGLAFPAIASTKSVPFWQALTTSNQLSSPEMSFWLGRDPTATTANVLVQGGVFTLGGTNSTLFSGDISFTNLDNTQPPSFWLIPLTSKY